MSTTTIPSKTIKTCDCCGVVMDNSTARKEGGLSLKAHALDMYGHACADASRNIDLCDSCLHLVTQAINSAVAAFKEKAKV